VSKNYESYIGDPGDEHVERPLREQIVWYRDAEGYLWPTPAIGRVLVDTNDKLDADC
jgi:hypothetical protein